MRAWRCSGCWPTYGLHENGAFGLSRALPYASYLASRGEPELRQVITEIAWRWFGSDRDYPGAWAPSGADFLTPALAEAELMSQLLPVADFGAWLDAFLPGIAERNPAALFTPVRVTDAVTDGPYAVEHFLAYYALILLSEA
ncbi:DUF2891 family protein [Amycolatopsis sp. WGS_07]|uniref:DUF2891 family protein n=1 Tax=Amycolatopsis sp. WGS_07 TaxID=3076764 RepID=UPI003872CBD9